MASPQLPQEIHVAVEAARALPFSYGVRVLRSPDDRIVVVLGEGHLKLRRAAAVGKQLVEVFGLRGVESFPGRRVWGGQWLKWFVEGPRTLLRCLSLGHVKDSTIADARAASSGKTVFLEQVPTIPLGLRVGVFYAAVFLTVVATTLIVAPLQERLSARLIGPLGLCFYLLQLHLIALIPAIALQRRPWSWIIHPFIAMLTLRNITMAEGTKRMLDENPGHDPALVIMGRAHLGGYERHLVQRYRFTKEYQSAE